MTSTRFIIILILGLMFALPPQYAFAVDVTTVTNTTDYSTTTFDCKQSKEHFVEELVTCIEKPIKSTILNPTNGIANRIINYTKPLTTAIITVAIAVLGIKIMSGSQNISQQTIGLLIRIGLVVYLLDATEFPKNAKKIFDIFDELLTLVSGGFNPWVQIDKFLGRLLGFTDYAGNCDLLSTTCTKTGVFDGVITLLSGSLFSKNFGVMITVIGGFAVFSLVIFIIQALFVYLSSVLALTFLIIISPIFIPFFVFKHSEQYLITWFNLVMSAMLAPMMMFALLSLFLTATPGNTTAKTATATMPAMPVISSTVSIFEDLVDKIFTTLNRAGPNYAEACSARFYLENPTVKTTDSSSYNNAVLNNPTIKNAGAIVINAFNLEDTSAFQSYSAPLFTKAAANAPSPSFSVIDCGPNDQSIKQDLIKLFIQMLLWALLMNAVLSMIPPIAAEIAGGVSVGVTDATGIISDVARRMSKK